MISTQDLAELRQTERRHMIGVKNAFAAGLDLALEGKAPAFAFYKACMEYLTFSLGRFHAQGRGNTGRLRPLVSDIPDDLKIVDDIDAMLDKSEKEIALLKSTFERYTRDQETGRGAFEEAGRRYIAFYGSTFVRRKDPAQHIIARHFDEEEYWRLTNDFTPDSIATERRLFEAVKAAAPAGVQVEWHPQ